MRVLTVQIDGKIPNLALCKVRAYHRARGDTITDSDPEKVYISSIFTQNRQQALGVGRLYPGAEVLYGGPGIDLKARLSQAIEDTPVDWAAEGMDYAIGFTSRGCTWRCPYCVVPEMEGHIREHHTIEHITQGLKKVMLLDNNMLSSPRALSDLEALREGGYKVCFAQGMDLRLVDHRYASVIADLDYRNTHFKARQLYFAWDLMGNEEGVRRGLRLLIDAGVRPANIMVYMLTNYNTTFDQDYYRYRVLWEGCGVLPFVMVYNRHKAPAQSRHFARWVNKRIHKVAPWSEYKWGGRDEALRLPPRVLGPVETEDSEP